MGNLIKTSRFISLILRHKPETIGIKLDEHGWANVEELIIGVNKKYPIDMQILEKIVDEDDKNRLQKDGRKWNRIFLIRE